VKDQYSPQMPQTNSQRSPLSLWRIQWSFECLI
jgi:hypothetical protein